VMGWNGMEWDVPYSCATPLLTVFGSFITGPSEGSEALGSSSKREHKRLKQWGKKGKKLRDKDPYGEDSGVISYVAHTTNRNQAALPSQLKQTRTTLLAGREDPVIFRTVHPHHTVVGASRGLA